MAEPEPSQHRPDAEDGDLDDAILLPSVQERQWLIDALASLVKKRGHEHLVLAPMLEPTERFFPDRWAGGEASLRRLLRRLFIYADLEATRPEVVVHEDEDVGGPIAPAGIGAAIWFVRRSDDVLHFAAREGALRDPAHLVAATARAVAEGWRAHHRLTVSDPVLEQRLTDVTSIYLGFGRLTTDASLRHAAERTGGFRLQRKTTRLGVLPPQAFAWLLAVQAMARDLDPRALRDIARGLQPNQAGFFKAALERLRERQPPIAEALDLPPRQQWGEGPSLSMLTAAFDDEGEGPEATEETRRDQDRGVLGINEGKPVFRVERSKAWRLAKMLALPVVLLGLLAGRMQMGIEVEMWKIGAAAAALGLLGLAVGRLLPDRRCSEPRCGTPLSSETTTCPRCGGTVAGVIAHPKERLAAEEQWHAQQAEATSEPSDSSRQRRR